MDRDAVALRTTLLSAFALACLAACQPAREPARVGHAATPQRAPASGSAHAETVAVWALLDPADIRLGAAGKPSPARRRQTLSGGAAGAEQHLPRGPVAAAASRVEQPSPPPAGPSLPRHANPLTPGVLLPRHVPPRAPAGAGYQPAPADGLLSAELYDPRNTAIAVLQTPGEALRGLPADTSGQVDWVQSLRQNAIAPRATLHGEDAMQTRDDDIVMRDTAAMPWVLFPHRAHTEWLACSNCHPAPFAAREGGNDIRMDDIYRGRWCGQCHDRVAFATIRCERCHNVLHRDSPNAWWQAARRP